MQEIGVLLFRLGRRGMAGSPSDLFAVARENRAPVVAVGLGDLLLRRAVEIHLPKLEVAAVGLGGEDVVAPIDCPNVALTVIGFGRARGAGEMSGRVEDVFVIGK